MIGSFTLAELATLLAGELRGNDVEFDSVSTDTRSLAQSDLFVALKGPNFDGDDYVLAAHDKGACAALVSRFSDCPIPQLRVADTEKALGLIGLQNRDRSDACFVAVTGSQGKTTIKEMTGHILSGVASTLMTQGNLNNAIGVPLTLLRLAADHRFAVMELGANHIGEIAWTTRLVKPSIAVISNATPTHLEGFGSLEGVVQGKGELLEGLSDDGVAVLNRDDPAWPRWRERAGRHKVVSFSLTAADAQYRAAGIRLQPGQNTEFQLVTPGGSASISLPLPGQHNVSNAIAAAAATLEAGVALSDVVAGLARTRAVKGRMCVLRGFADSRLIDDTYNASPNSFAAAIKVLCDFPGQKLLVAGDMGELGADSAALHARVGETAKAAGVDHLLTVGRDSAAASAAFGSAARHFASQAELVSVCKTMMNKQTTVLVKGSRSANMDKIVDLLIFNEAN